MNLLVFIRRFTRTFAWLSTLIIILLSSCGVHENLVPATLIISFVPDYDMAAKANRLQPIADYLKNKLKLKKVTILSCSDYASVIEAMKAKKVDIAYFGQFSYVLAHARARAEAMVLVGTSKGPEIGNSVIMVNPKLSIYTIDDLKKQASGLIIGFSDPSSTTGHIVPRGFLASVGLNAEKNFKHMYFASSHGAVILTVKTGKVDVGCSNTNTIKKLILKGMIKEDDVRIIWKSPDMVTSPVAIRSDLPPGFKEKIKKAYLDLPAVSPEVWHTFVDKEYLYYDDDVRKNLVYLPSDDSLYNNIRKIANSLDPKLLLHP